MYLGDTECGHCHVCSSPHEIIHHPVPRVVPIQVPVLVIVRYVQLYLKVEISSQPFQQHDRQTLTTADVVRITLVLNVIREVVKYIIEVLLVVRVHAKACHGGQTLVVHRRLLDDEGLRDDGDHPECPRTVRDRPGHGADLAVGPEDGVVLEDVVGEPPDHLPVLRAVLGEDEVVDLEVVRTVPHSVLVERKLTVRTWNRRVLHYSGNSRLFQRKI